MLTKEELNRFNKFADVNNPRMSVIFGVLGDPNRCKIFRLILAKARLCGGDFAQILEISAPAVSQHLRQLEMAGMIEKKKEGQKVFFKALTRDPLIKAIINAVAK